MVKDTKQQILEILNVTYSRIMRLQFSHSITRMLITGNHSDNHWKYLPWCIQVSFATDAYTTISGLYSSGNYSFERLGQIHAELRSEYKQSYNRLKAILPGLFDNRNQMFCHFVKEIDAASIRNMLNNFIPLLDEMIRFHSLCVQTCKIRENELSVYSPEDFKDIQEEFFGLDMILMDGSMAQWRKRLEAILRGRTDEST